MFKKKILSMLFQEVPEMRGLLDEQLKDSFIELERDGIRVIWGIEIAPCIEQLLREAEKNQALLKKIFGMIEKLAADPDGETQYFVLHNILQPIRNEKEVTPIAMRFMGEETKQCWKELGEYWREFQLWQLSRIQG